MGKHEPEEEVANELARPLLQSHHQHQDDSFEDSTSSIELDSYELAEFADSTADLGKSSKSSSFWDRILGSVRLIASQWFIFAIGLVILVASQVQVPMKHQKLKGILVTRICVSLIFLLIGCTLKTRTLIDNLPRWKIHLWVQIQCFFMTSSVIFAVVTICATNKNFMDPGLLLGMVLAGCTPTGFSSNVVMTGEAHGNQPLTVIQSTLGNFLGPFLTPLLFFMYISSNPWYAQVLPPESGGYGEIYQRVFALLVPSIFVPIVIGQAVQNVFPDFTNRVIIGYRISKVSSFCLLALIWQVYDQAFASHAFDTVKASNIVAVALASISCFFLFMGISFCASLIWLPKEDVISVCYCVPSKTPAMGIPLVMSMFVGLTSNLQAKLQVPLVIYQGLQIVGGSILITPFKNWIAVSKEKIGREISEIGAAV